nr:cytochrome c oxidase subunit II [Lepidoglyphus destructor]
MPSWMSLCFQDSCSPLMSQFSFLHDHVMMIMTVVIVFISYIMVCTLSSSFYYKHFSEGTFIESIWSIIPAFLLVILVVPSMGILYMSEDIKSPSLTFKVVAHQWYWTYVCPLLNGLSYRMDGGSVHSLYEYDSFMEPCSLSSDFPRLLGSSSDLFLPVNTTLRFMISSTDVIHSFAVPSLGLKVDALPGRINQLFANPTRLGAFYGQCSEICGSNHSFMPISVKVCNLEEFDKVSTEYLLDLLEFSSLKV